MIDGEVVTTVPAETDESERLPFEADLPEDLEAGTSIQFYQVDEYGRTSSTTVTVVADGEDDQDILDMDLPLPEPNPITPSARALTGERVSGADLVITVDGEEFTIIEATQDPEENPSVIQMESFDYLLEEDFYFESSQTVGFTHVDDLGRESKTVEVEVANLLLPPSAATIRENENVIEGQKALGSRVYTLVDGEYVGNNYESPESNEEANTSLLRRFANLFTTEPEVQVLPDSADVLDELAIPNGEDFELILEDTYPAGTVIELYQVNDEIEEGTELVSEPTQVVVQPLEEEDPAEEPIAAPYLPWNIIEGETELRGTAYNRNASVFIEINGEVVEEFTPDELGQYGDFRYSYPTRPETDDVIEVYQVSESGLEGERTRRTIQSVHPAFIQEVYEYSTRISGVIPSPASSSAQGVFVEYMGQTFPINILDGYRIDQDLDLSMVDDGPLPVGAEISVFGIDVWGERVGELTRVVRESIEEPRIHTIDSTDTEIYITPSDGLTDIALFADGEFLGRAYAYYFIDRHVLALDEPLAPGTHVEAFHYEPQRWDQYDAYSGNRRSGIADFVVQENVPERQVGIAARDLWVVGEYTYPPRQWEEGLSGWQDYNPYVPHSPEPVSPSVGTLTDQDIEISGEYSTEYALVGVRMDTDEVIYVENRRGEDPQSA